jgi:hypothetical protein
LDLEVAVETTTVAGDYVSLHIRLTGCITDKLREPIDARQNSAISPNDAGRWTAKGPLSDELRSMEEWYR